MLRVHRLAVIIIFKGFLVESRIHVPSILVSPGPGEAKQPHTVTLSPPCLTDLFMKTPKQFSSSVHIILP